MSSCKRRGRVNEPAQSAAEKAERPPPTAEAAGAPPPSSEPAAATALIKVPAPSARDPLWFSPLFVLAPARSHSSVVTAMLGAHPELYGFPELALFRRPLVSELGVDPPGWRGARAQYRLSGLWRAIAEVNDGEQTDATVAAAAAWLRARGEWRSEQVYDYLLAEVAPRVGVEKAPEDSSREEYLARLVAAYPRARFLHLVRHPITTARSMHRVWKDLGYWNIEPALFYNFCLGVWYYQHERIHRLVSTLPPDRGYRVRSEDVLNAPDETLPGICRWMRIDASQGALDAMRHPERSPHARPGPASAAGGGDHAFFANPVPHATELPESLDLPNEWNVDGWLLLSVLELAAELGYSHRVPA